MTPATAQALVLVAADPGAYTASELGLSPTDVRRLRRAGHVAPPGVYLTPAGRRAAEDQSEVYATIVHGVPRMHLLGEVLAALLEEEPLSVAGLARALGHTVSGALKAAVETGHAYGYLTLPMGLVVTESGLAAMSRWPDVAAAVRAELDYIEEAAREVRVAPLRQREEELLRQVALVRVDLAVAR